MNARERDQTHSYWYKPSAPRVNYSLLIMENTGMMKMAIGEGFPLRQGAVMDLDWFSVAMEASGDGTRVSWFSLIFLGYMDIYRRKKSVRGAMRGPQGWGRAHRACGPLGHPLDVRPTPKIPINTQNPIKNPI